MSSVLVSYRACSLYVVNVQWCWCNNQNVYYIMLQQTKNAVLTRKDGVQRVHRPLGHAVLDVQHLVSDETAVTPAVTVIAVRVVSARSRGRPPQRFGHLGVLALHEAAHRALTSIQTIAVDCFVSTSSHQLCRSGIARRACTHYKI